MFVMGFPRLSEVMSSATAKNQARSMILESPFIAPSLIEVWTRAYSNGVFGVVLVVSLSGYELEQGLRLMNLIYH
jgi:hypothetical protein